MRSIGAAILFCLINPVSDLAYGQTAPEPTAPAKPRVYALVAAIGEHFDQVHEVASTGSHLSPYRHRTSTVQNNALNRLALHSLDKAIATIDPLSTRIYLALPAALMDGVAPSERDNVAIAAVVAALENMPQRLEWDQIVVATPAYRALNQNAMAGKLQGFGVFNEQVCQACGSPFSIVPSWLDVEPPGGVAATTMDNKTIQARTFIAPFSYIEVWVLDPKTLAVLDKQQAFDSQKLAEPSYKPPLDVSDADVQKYLANRFVNLVELSIGEAVMHSEVSLLRGKVDVGPVRAIEPEDVKK